MSESEHFPMLVPTAAHAPLLHLRAIGGLAAVVHAPAGHQVRDVVVAGIRRHQVPQLVAARAAAPLLQAGTVEIQPAGIQA